MIVIILDFDDTIFATTHYTKKEKIQCPILEESVNELINTAKRYGKVYIISNAMKEWINDCLEKVIPNCKDSINSVDIISTVDCGYSNNSTYDRWKFNAFSSILKSHFNNEDKHHLLSIGDNIYDRTAALGIRYLYNNVTVKNILIPEYPNLGRLLMYHRILILSIPQLSSCQKYLDLTIKDYVLDHYKEPEREKFITIFDNIFDRTYEKTCPELFVRTSSDL